MRKWKLSMGQILNFMNGVWTFSDFAGMRVRPFQKIKLKIEIITKSADIHFYQKYIDMINF